MEIGVFADTHDHLDNIRRAVAFFNRRKIDLAIFAGDFVSTFALPPLRRLQCPLVASFGDNEGNRSGIMGGMRILGVIGDPPFCYRADDGTKILVTHQKELVRDLVPGVDVVVYAHTHKPAVFCDAEGVLHLNPGECSGWTYRRPTVAVLDTTAREAEIIELAEIELDVAS